MNITEESISVYDSGELFFNGKRLKTYLDKNGYEIICISSKGKTINFKAHRLIAKKLIPNPQNKPCVNHKNGIKTDNRIENLEWVTHRENMLHAHKIGLSKSPMKNKHGKDHSRSQPVAMIGICGSFLMFFDSAQEAHEVTGISRQRISSTRTGRFKLAGGYRWI